MTKTLVHPHLHLHLCGEFESLIASRWSRCGEHGKPRGKSRGNPHSSFQSIRTSLASAPAQRSF
jgi:hypothetical protein